MNKTWRKLKVCRTELQLGPTLGGGQNFRWKNTEGDNWIGIFSNKVWILSQEDNYLLYKTYDRESLSASNKQDENPQVDADKKVENMLKSYFRLDINLSDHYRIWSEADTYFRKAAPKMFGIRILNQEVIENIFSFICSSNNNIKRISLMVEKLCDLYGDIIIEVNNEKFRSFPTTEKLSGNNVESELRKAGFGYRAKFIYHTACLIEKLGGSIWVENLKLLSYHDAKKELMKLPGIGAKVADCICLMSLGHMNAVPVDTHIFQVATKIYLPHLKKCKSLTNKVYEEIGDYFRSLHGPYAGWANTVLAKKGSSSEEDRNVVPVLVYPNVDSQPMFVISGGKGNRKPKHYPQGRPFQVQQHMGEPYPQTTSVFPQQSGYQNFFRPQGSPRPFDQNSFSSFPSMNSPQRPNSFNNPSSYPNMGLSVSSRPFYAGSGRPNQFSGNNRPNQFPETSQFSASSKFPGNGQSYLNAQFPGSTFPLTK